jgi:hypothetical protein
MEPLGAVFDHIQHCNPESDESLNTLNDQLSRQQGLMIDIARGSAAAAQDNQAVVSPLLNAVGLFETRAYGLAQIHLL